MFVALILRQSLHYYFYFQLLTFVFHASQGTFNPAKDLEKRLKEGGIEEESGEEDDEKEADASADALSSIPTVQDGDDGESDEDSDEDSDD